MRTSRAFTLLETLISASLGMVVLGLLLESWLMASRAWTQAEQNQSAQRSTLAVSYRMTHDFDCSLVGSLAVNATSPLTVVSFISDDTPAWNNTTGAMQFRRWVQYRYHSDSQIVERREVYLNPPVEALNATVSAPGWDLSQPGGTLLGQSVTRFQVNSASSSPLLSVALQSSSGTVSSSMAVQVLSRFYGQD